MLMFSIRPGSTSIISPSFSMLSWVKLSEQNSPITREMLSRYQLAISRRMLENCWSRTPSTWHGTPTTASGRTSRRIASRRARVFGE